MSEDGLAELGLRLPLMSDAAPALRQTAGESPATITPVGASQSFGWADDGDEYGRLKQVMHQLEFVCLQQDYIKDEQRHLKRELVRGREELKRLRTVPLVVGHFNEMVGDDYAVVATTSGHTCKSSPWPFLFDFRAVVVAYVRVMSTIDRELLKPGVTIALHRQSQAVVDVLPADADTSVLNTEMAEKPDVKYSDIGGMDIQKQEIREAVELPLTHPELYQQIGLLPVHNPQLKD